MKASSHRATFLLLLLSHFPELAFSQLSSKTRIPFRIFTQYCVILLALTLFSAACGTAPEAQALAFVTVNPDASPTATPFQPALQPTPTPFQPVFPTPTGTILPTPTNNPLIVATTTPEPALTALMALPTVDLNLQLTPVAPLDSQETINFLLIGSDRRPGGSFRTDTLVIAMLRPKEGQVSLISIPRDLWVYIPDYGNQRINVAYQQGELSGYPGGGPGLLEATVLYNLGIRIDHTAMVEFNGFQHIIDTLGGIDVPVACPYTDWRLIDPSYDPNIEANWWLYTVGPGLVHMDGDLALWYARSRMRSSDFDRGRRQQETLRAIYARVLQTGTISRLPALYKDLTSIVETDITLTEMLQLALYAPKLTNANFRSYYIRPPLVTAWTTPGGASVQLPNEGPLSAMLQEAMAPSQRAAERETITIEIQNGTPNEGWAELAASRLNYAGFETHIAPADRQDYTYSTLLDLNAVTDANRNNTILSALGLPQSNLAVIPDSSSPVNYRLILGADYNPCFSPEQLSH
jgi:LCP family protein required for cell wall assembly